MPDLYILSLLLRPIRRWIRKKRRKLMKYWDRFKWCLIGGFGYAAARFLADKLQEVLP